ncbi:B1 protein-like [Cryptotermes secundus]|uniref:B1 protein-like n=1 Tax=Cryptotermes secundus TaxID=105785 RepID=UPI000CD7B3CA|nr:B1 protein-like [Cryptotermes secundus]
MLLLPAAIALLCAGVAVADSRLAELDADTREMLQMLHNTCVEQTGVDEGLIDKARHGDFSEDDKLKEYLGCAFQQTGALSEDGEADYDTLLGMLPDQFQERAGKMIDKCRHIRENSAAATAFELNKCLYKADPEYYFII